jgi:hypothetical protein
MPPCLPPTRTGGDSRRRTSTRLSSQRRETLINDEALLRWPTPSEQSPGTLTKKVLYQMKSLAPPSERDENERVAIPWVGSVDSISLLTLSTAADDDNALSPSRELILHLSFPLSPPHRGGFSLLRVCRSDAVYRLDTVSRLNQANPVCSRKQRIFILSSTDRDSSSKWVR